MKMILKLRLAVIVMLFMITSCDKDNVDRVSLHASFGIELPENKIDTFSSLIWPSWVSLFTQNTSTGADSYVWDLGDGRILSNKQPALLYTKSGEYELKLTVSKDGHTSSAIKKINIKDRTINALTVQSLNWNTLFHTNLNWPVNKTADVFFRIYSWDGVGYPEMDGEQYTATLLYESPVKADISPLNTPFSIPVDKKSILQHPSAKAKYGYCLYAKDEGQEYLLLSNWGFGLHNEFYEDYRMRQCYLELGINSTQIKLNGSY